MTITNSDLNELLDAVRAGGDIDVVRRGVELMLQALIDAEATAQIGADRFERSSTRTTQRNGTRDRLLSTKAGDVDLKIPKLRQGSFFPSILERRRRIDRALFAVVMEAYVHGVSTRKVDDLVAALGLESGISKSEVSRICAELDEQLGAFRARSLAHVEFPYVFLDATYLKGRVDHQVVSRAVVVATGVSMDGNREVLGCAVGHSEDGAFWTEFLRSLRARGLKGVRLVISDQHLGLKKAIEAVMVGSAWQRCRVHFMRNVLARVKRNNTHMVIAAIQTIFAQPDAGLGPRAVRPDRRRPWRASSPTWPPCSPTPRRTCWPSRPSPRPTGGRSGPPTPWSASTGRSSAAPTWSGCSPTTGRSSAWSPRWWSRPTTSGRWPSAATCRRPRWPSSAGTRRRPSRLEALESRPLAG